jgi:hypothetical protein
MKYWDNQGKYQAEFNQLSEQLMPAMGAAESLAGELIRSANRVYYDAFNNGFCNNTSGAINYLYRFLAPLFPNDRDLKEALDYIAPKTNTGGYSSTGLTTGAALDLIVDRVYEAIRDNGSLKTTANPCDLFDLQDDDYREEDDDYEEEDDDYEED